MFWPVERFVRILFVMLIAALFGVTACAAAPDDEQFLLARQWESGRDPADYWVSEKLDGVRARWDGESLRGRGGGVIAAPSWFVDALPRLPLDGELWLGRGRFEALSAIVRKQVARDEQWRSVRFMVFELPGGAGDFTARLARLERIVAAAGVPWLSLVPQFRVRDARELDKRLQELVAAGAEGLMLHRADAPYLTGRGDALYKLKTVDDAEARVVAHLPGKGRYRGMTGALLLEMPDGRRFRVGSGLSDALRHEPPPLGTVVTYRYRGLTGGGIPRFATFWRIRALPDGS